MSRRKIYGFGIGFCITLLVSVNIQVGSAILYPLEDPLVYSTLFGGNGSAVACCVCVDTSEAIYVAGTTSASNFPVTQGANQTEFAGGGDAFVMKLSPSYHIIWASFLGGSLYEVILQIEVDASGCVYVMGLTNSQDFPVTSNAIWATKPQQVDPWIYDGFITKFSANGSILMFSSYLNGGYQDARFNDMVVWNESVFLVGYTAGDLFPSTQGANQTQPGGAYDAFVMKVSMNGDLDYATYWGGSGNDYGISICVDSLGYAYVLGQSSDYQGSNFPVTPGAYNETQWGYQDIVIGRLTPDGSWFNFSTYFGGKGEDGIEIGSAGANCLRWDAQGNLVFCFSLVEVYPFLTTVGSLNASYGQTIIIRMTSDGKYVLNAAQLDMSTQYLRTLCIDGKGNIYMCGSSNMWEGNMPVTMGAWDISYNGGDGDAFLVGIDENFTTVIYGTWLGGEANDKGMDIAIIGESVILVGETDSVNFPTTDGSRSVNGPAFVSQFIPSIQKIESSITSTVGFVYYEGEVNNTIIWKITDSLIWNPSYQVYCNGILNKTGIWASGENITVNVDGLPIGIHSWKIIAFDGINEHYENTIVVMVIQREVIPPQEEPEVGINVSSALAIGFGVLSCVVAVSLYLLVMQLKKRNVLG